jgi:dCMP deaminase
MCSNDEAILGRLFHGDHPASGYHARRVCVGQVGAIIVRDKRILCTGYNGAPRGVLHLRRARCLRAELGIPSGSGKRLSRPARRAERHHPCGAARHLGGGRRDQCNAPALHDVRENGCHAGIVRVVCAKLYPDDRRAGCSMRPAFALEVWETEQAIR